jgi:phosphoribosyl-AMP cyclohydrolase
MSVILRFDKGDGLVPAIAQDAETGKVLMLAYVNEKTWKLSLETGVAHYWSRSRNKIWKKGETSGNIQEIKEILVDCDEDTVIFKVRQIGDAACHTGHETCFYRRLEKDGSTTVVDQLVFDPQKVYQP